MGRELHISTSKRPAVARFAAVALSSLLSCGIGNADPNVVISTGLPTQIKPTYQEPGLPAFNFPAGGTATLGGSSYNNFGNTNTNTNKDTSYNNTGATSGGGDNGGTALAVMNAQTWGDQATTAAYAMGINPSALAGTCIMESGCKNSASSGSSSASGVWQMIDSTYQADIAGALALDPSIASSLVQGLAGKMDPGTEAYAAAYELRQDAIILQNQGVANPTVIQARALYQFGQSGGLAVATADDSDNLAARLNLTPAQLALNGISLTTTVGQWRQTIASKLGGTANQIILAGN